MNSVGIDFRPFRAWRYETGRVELSQVIAPPYDVISPQEQAALYERSSFNVVRLILGKEANFYGHARQCWEEWTRSGVLVQDKRPAFYLYEQNFAHPWDRRPLRRLALIGTLKLGTPGSVLAHEATFAAPRRDRFLLLEKTETHLSPVFGLYPNSKKKLAPLLSPHREKPVLFEARDPQGVLHRGWAIEKEEEQKAIREILARESVLIADGHHRFETALEYRRQRRERSPQTPGEAPFDFVLMALVAFEDEGLLVLPTHRVVRSFGSLPRKEFLNRLRTHFDFQPEPEAKLFETLTRQPQKEKVFGGFFGSEGNFLLRLKNLEEVRKILPPGKPSLWYETEANLLTSLVVKMLWGPSEEEYQKAVTYTHAWEEAAEAVRQGKAEAAFLMRAPAVGTIQALAEKGERMPQKTTYFYPKLADGLFFYHLD